MLRVSACARGRVQGVGYRYFVTDCAQKTGVSGFVMNMPDGSVCIIAEGSAGTLERFLAMVRAADDPYIRVESLDVTWDEPTGEFPGFDIRF